MGHARIVRLRLIEARPQALGEDLDVRLTQHGTAGAAIWPYAHDESARPIASLCSVAEAAAARRASPPPRTTQMAEARNKYPVGNPARNKDVRFSERCAAEDVTAGPDRRSRTSQCRGSAPCIVSIPEPR